MARKATSGPKGEITLKIARSWAVYLGSTPEPKGFGEAGLVLRFRALGLNLEISDMF